MDANQKQLPYTNQTSKMSEFDWDSMVARPNVNISEQDIDEEMWLNNLLSKPILIPDLNDVTSLFQDTCSASTVSSLSSSLNSSLNNSLSNSLNNSPIIKPEDSQLSLPELILSNSFDDFKTPPPLPLHQTQFEKLPVSVESTPTATSTSTSTAATKKKKRAPRKRLTAHQKQAHNKIEKKYRININTKIANLQSIIPWVSSEKTAFEVSPSTTTTTPNDESDNETVPRLNKSMILEKATAYILHLQKNEISYLRENEILKDEIRRLGGDVDKLVEFAG